MSSRHGKHSYFAQVTLIEAVATFCRKAREPNSFLRITPEERDRVITNFHQDIRKQYGVVDVTVPIYIKAGDLCRHHPLRSYDAVQLACALTANQKLIVLGQPPLVFLSADNKLLDIAHLEGLSIENPNNHL